MKNFICSDDVYNKNGKQCHQATAIVQRSRLTELGFHKNEWTECSLNENQVEKRNANYGWIKFWRNWWIGILAGLLFNCSGAKDALNKYHTYIRWRADKAREYVISFLMLLLCIIFRSANERFLHINANTVYYEVSMAASLLISKRTLCTHNAITNWSIYYEAETTDIMYLFYFKLFFFCPHIYYYYHFDAVSWRKRTESGMLFWIRFLIFIVISIFFFFYASLYIVGMPQDMGTIKRVLVNRTICTL